MSDQNITYVMSWGTPPGSDTCLLDVKEVREHPVIRVLLKEARRLRMRVSFAKKRNWSLGSHDMKKRKLTVQLCDPIGTPFEIEDVIFILAHEVRHEQHVDEGIYRAYYRMKKSCTWQMGLAAERDCDKFATEFCKKNNTISYLCGRKYPGWKVALANPPKPWKMEYLLTRYWYQDMIDNNGNIWDDRYIWLLSKLSLKLFNMKNTGESAMTVTIGN